MLPAPHAHRGIGFRFATAMASGVVDVTSWRAAFRSRADCQRFSGSFSRQRFNTLASAAGATSEIDGAGRS